MRVISLFHHAESSPYCLHFYFLVSRPVTGGIQFHSVVVFFFVYMRSR
jgi:hypothetical protein